METVSPRGEKNRVVASLRSFSRAAHARQRVLYARVKEWQALGGNIWPHTRRSRVELEAKWHSTSKKYKAFPRFWAFARSWRRGRSVWRRRGIRREAVVPLLSRPRSFVPISYCSRCLINAPKSLDSRRYSTTILFVNTSSSTARVFGLISCRSIER